MFTQGEKRVEEGLSILNQDSAGWNFTLVHMLLKQMLAFQIQASDRREILI